MSTFVASFERSVPEADVFRTEADYLSLDDVEMQFTEPETDWTLPEPESNLTVPELESRLADLKATRVRTLSALLPVEQAARPLMEDEFNRREQELIRALQDIKQRQARTERDLERQSVLLSLGMQPRRINMEFLKLRKESAHSKELVPLFAVFDLNQDCAFLQVCVGRAALGWVRFMATRAMNVPSLSAHYEATFMALAKRGAVTLKRAQGKTQAYIQLVARFAGLIPAPIKERVPRYRGLFDELFMVAEAPDWEMTEFTQAVSERAPSIRVNRDPLLIGRHGQKYWLLEKFDTTPAEDYVSREFTD